MLSKSERIIRNEQSRDIGDTKHRTKTNIQTKYSQKTNKNMSKTEPTKKPAVTKVLARGKQFLLLIGHLSFYSCSKVMLDTTIRSIVFFALWCLTSLSSIFQLYRGGQFSWRRKPEYPLYVNDI